MITEMINLLGEEFHFLRTRSRIPGVPNKDKLGLITQLNYTEIVLIDRLRNLVKQDILNHPPEVLESILIQLASSPRQSLSQIALEKVYGVDYIRHFLVGNDLVHTRLVGRNRLDPGAYVNVTLTVKGGLELTKLREQHAHSQD